MRLGLRRHSSGSVSSNVFVSYAAHADADFARAVVARLRLERPHLRVAVETEDERVAGAAAVGASSMARLQVDARQSGPPTSAGLILVALTRETFECPLVLQEMAMCLSYAREASVEEHVRVPRLAFVYNVRSGRGQDPSELIRTHAPTWLQVGMEGLGSDTPGALLRSKAAVPIFEYLHEYDDLCVSAVLKFLDANDAGDDLPSSGTMQRLHSSLRAAANILRSPAKSLPPDSPARTLPPINSPGGMNRSSVVRGSVGGTAGNLGDFSLNASAVKSAPARMKSIAVGLLYDPDGPGKAIAGDVEYACACTFGTTVRTAEVGGKNGVTLESVANLMVIITPGAFSCEMIVDILTKALRAGGVNILLLQDVRTVPNIWAEFEALPAALRPGIVSIIAVPYLRSHGFSACLARLAGTELLRPVACAESPTAKPAATEYGRSKTQKLFDLFLCHFQRTGLDWAFAMRLGFVRHAGVGFRTFLDVQSLQNVNECGRFVEQSHAIAVLITRGIFTRMFCQRELIFARRAGVQIIFIQHMRSCIDIDEELNLVRMEPSDFMSSEYGMEYARAGGTEASFATFQQALFQQIWTPKFRPPVFAYIHELEETCVSEIVGYLRNRRAHRAVGIEQLDQAARALLDFLRMSPDDKGDVRSGLAALANQAAAGNGDEFCEAIVRVKALPAVSESLRRHGSTDTGVVYQALRSLRTTAATRAGSSALVQFGTADGALATLYDVLKSQADVARPDNTQLRREALAVLRAFRNGDATVQQALHRAGLHREYNELFQRLRAELEPLDAIREQLNLDPVQLPALEFALGHWHRTQPSKDSQACTAGSLPSEVAYANELLGSVRDLRDAVAREDGERADVLLQEHVKDVERCAGVEALLREAQRIAHEFKEKLRLQKEQLRSEEELAKARRAAQDKLEDLLARAAEDPKAELMTQLEESIVNGHELKCSQGVLEKARNTLDELRLIFERPSAFIEAPEKMVSHTTPFAGILALMSHYSKDRHMVLRCLEVQKRLVEEESGAPPLVKRQDVDKVLDIIKEYPADNDMQVAAFECMTSFLRVTRVQHGAISSRALVQHADKDDILAVDAAISALSTQRRSALQKARGLDAEVLGAACKSLVEIARMGDQVSAYIKRVQGMAQLWYIIRELGAEGRQKHADTVVAFTIATFEEIGRHSGPVRGFAAIVTLLKFCDIYDSETPVCIPALRSICALFSEKPEWTGMLVGTMEMPEDPTIGHKPGTVSEDGIGVVLRTIRMHERQAEVQRLGYSIMGTTVQQLLLDRVSNNVLPSYLWCRAVQMAVVALRVHLLVAGTCQAVLSSLSSLVDFLPDLVCQEVVQAEGVAPTVRSMDRHPSELLIQQSGLKLMSRVTKRYPRQTLGEQNLRAIVQAMGVRPDDSLTQLFGCAALRSFSEQGLDAATSVAKLGSPALFKAMEACPGHVPLHGEAFRALELIAEANPELGRMLGDKHQAVLRVLNSVPALLSEPDSPQDIDTNMDRDTEGGDGLTCEVCVSACSTMRALLNARTLLDVSYDRLYHRGVCTSAETLTDLLSAFPRSHDLQLEALHLFQEAVTPDEDGAHAVGQVFAHQASALPSQQASNLITSALVRFHTDADCVVIFGLLSQLCVSEAFVASFMAVSGSVAEVLRWTGIFRDDQLIQTRFIALIDALLKSPTFDADLLMRAEGLEAIVLAAARHDHCRLGTEAPMLAVRLASRIAPEVFFLAMKTICERHESNAKVIGAACSILVAVFEADNQGHTFMRESGTMAALLKSVQQHRADRSVVQRVPRLVEVTLLDPAMRKFFLAKGVQNLLMDVLQDNFQPARRPDGPEWLVAVNASQRRADRDVLSEETMAAGFRALQRLFCLDKWRAVVNPELIELLMRTMAVTDSKPLMTDGIAIMKRILQISKAQMTWIACTGSEAYPVLDAKKLHLQQQIATTSRTAHNLEMRGIVAWRAGNFEAAAGDFRAALVHYQRLQNIAPKRLSRLLSEHLKNMPLNQYATMCEEQHGFVKAATEAARTVQDLSHTHLDSEDCPICFDSLKLAGAPLWQCGQCHQFMHEACIHQWGARSKTCPLCRKDLGNATRDTNAYLRARAVAQAAESRSQVHSRRSTNAGTGFLALSIAYLWRVAMRLGTVLGADTAMIEEDKLHAEALERAGKGACDKVSEISIKFEKGFVLPCELEANESGVTELEITSNVMETMAHEVLQRQCATLAEEAYVWEAEMTRLQDARRYDHAENLAQLIIAQLTEVANMANAAQLSDMNLRRHIEKLQETRAEFHSLRDRRDAVRSTGDVSAPRRPRPPLTPFVNCFAHTWDYGPMSLNALAAVRAITAAARASRAVAERDVQGSKKLMVLTRRITSACTHLVTALLQDRVLVQVAGFIGGGSDRRWHALLAISFFQQFQHCGPEARTACFMQLDQLVSVLSSARVHQDDQLKACICSLIRDLVFTGDNEERMVNRLQREAAPRSAWSLEEWYLDTLLVQNNAQAFRADILHALDTDAWMYCSGLGVSSDEDILSAGGH